MNARSPIDPTWAWAPFESTSSIPFDRRRAAHLYRRGGFGATRQQLDAAVAAGPRKAVQQLLNAEESDQERELAEHLVAAALAGGSIESGAAAWLHRMLTSPAQAREKLTLFWHGHFATGADKVTDLQLMQGQNRVLREHALGDFRELAQKISKDPAMLIYLDSATNRKSHPNENYARELMELFCLGEGNYTEDDVLELARCFTGWGVKRRRYKFNPYQHDEGVKRILGEQGPFSGEEAVDLVLKQDAVGTFIAGKLVKFLVMDEPTLSREQLEPLAQTFRASGLQILPLVEQILASNLFYSDHAIGKKIRSPVELAVGVMRCLEGSANALQLCNRLKDVGHGLYYPPNVKGWDGGRAWINTSTLLGRTNLMGELLRDKATRFDRGTIGEFASQAGIRRPDEAIDWWNGLILAVPLDEQFQSRLEQLADRADNEGLQRMLHALTALPQCQLG